METHENGEKLFRGRTFKILRCLKRRIDEYEKCESRTAAGTLMNSGYRDTKSNKF